MHPRSIWEQVYDILYTDALVQLDEYDSTLARQRAHAEVAVRRLQDTLQDDTQLQLLEELLQRHYTLQNAMCRTLYRQGLQDAALRSLN